MKKLSKILLVTFVFILSNCRKDPPLVGLPPSGNTLIMQLDENYAIDGAAELTLNANFMENTLALGFDSDLGAIPSKFVIYFLTSQDTILFFRDNKLLIPVLDTTRANKRDGRLFTRIAEDDFVPYLSSKFDAEQLRTAVGDSRLLHGYFNEPASKKISVYSSLLYILNEELGISIPTRKYFLMVSL